MKGVLCFALILFLSVPFAAALNCQYTEGETYQVEEQRFYQDGELIGTDLNLTELVPVQKSGLVLIITNSLRVPVTLDINYRMRSKWFGNSDRHYVVDVEAGGKEIIEDPALSSCGSSYPCVIDMLEYDYVEPHEITSEYVMVSKQREVCQLCLGVSCTNDGDACTKSSECGGGHCVEGRCANTPTCYDGDCRCAEGEAQCPDNTRCVKMTSLEVGATPACLPAECVTGFVGEKGLCAKSPEQLAAEKSERTSGYTKLIIIGLISILGVIILILIIKRILDKKGTIDKLKVIAASSDAATRQLKAKIKFQNKLRRDIDHFEKKLKKLQHIKKKSESEIMQIERLKNEIRDRKQDVRELNLELETLQREGWDNIVPFPYELIGNRLAIANPWLKGYLCFYDENLPLDKYPYSKMVHRWIWKKANGRWPRPEYHIHHIDGNKYNNHPDNLEEIEGEEHYRLHRDKS